MISPEDAARLTAYFEALDETRCEMDSKWGAGRLELLIARLDAGLFARFRAQQMLWRKALEDAWNGAYLTHDKLTLIEQRSGAMRRAWAVLDQHAEEAGQRPVAPWVWEVRLQDGGIAALVQSDAEAARVIAEGRYLTVYTAREIGNLIDAMPNALRAAKQHFPGSKLQPPDLFRRSGDSIPWDDPIPFGPPEAPPWEEDAA